MEKNFVLSGNKLIAEFMGYEYHPYSPESKMLAGWWKKDTPQNIRMLGGTARKLGNMHYFLCRRHHELRYWNSWDWLMPVVRTIGNIEYEVTDAAFLDRINLVVANWVDTPREEIFKQVVSFIEWYNTNRKNDMD